MLYAHATHVVHPSSGQWCISANYGFLYGVRCSYLMRCCSSVGMRRRASKYVPLYGLSDGPIHSIPPPKWSISASIYTLCTILHHLCTPIYVVSELYPRSTDLVVCCCPSNNVSPTCHLPSLPMLYARIMGSASNTVHARARGIRVGA